MSPIDIYIDGFYCNDGSLHSSYFNDNSFYGLFLRIILRVLLPNQLDENFTFFVIVVVLKVKHIYHPLLHTYNRWIFEWKSVLVLFHFGMDDGLFLIWWASASLQTKTTQINEWNFLCWLFIWGKSLLNLYENKTLINFFLI